MDITALELKFTDLCVCRIVVEEHVTVSFGRNSKIFIKVKIHLDLHSQLVLTWKCRK